MPGGHRRGCPGSQMVEQRLTQSCAAAVPVDPKRLSDHALPELAGSQAAALFVAFKETRQFEEAGKLCKILIHCTDLDHSAGAQNLQTLVAFDEEPALLEAAMGVCRAAMA